MHKRVIVIFSGITLATILFISANVYAGKLYIKPDLERKRAARILSEGDTDFRNGKIHITLDPEVALTEFEFAKEKYKQAIELIEDFGAGYYTPGDVEDFENRIKECDLWIRKCRENIEKEKR